MLLARTAWGWFGGISVAVLVVLLVAPHVPPAAAAQNGCCFTAPVAITVTWSGSVKESLVETTVEGKTYVDDLETSYSFRESQGFDLEGTAVTPAQSQANGTETETDNYPGSTAENCTGTLSATPIVQDPESDFYQSGLVDGEGGSSVVTIGAFTPTGAGDLIATGSGDCANPWSGSCCTDSAAYQVALDPGEGSSAPVTFPISQANYSQPFTDSESGPDPEIEDATFSLKLGGTLTATYTPCTGPTSAGSSPDLSFDDSATSPAPASRMAASPALAHATASGRIGGEYDFTTKYSGGFSYSSYVCTDTGATDQVSTTYEFSKVQIDSYTLHAHHRFTEQLVVTASASGGTHETKTDGGKQTYANTCTITSVNRPYTASRQGTQIIDSEYGNDNIDYFVSWQVPWLTDSMGTYVFDGVPAGAPGVGETCTQTPPTAGLGNYTVPDGTSLVPNYDKTIALQWQAHALPACGGDYLTPTDTFFGLWNGHEDLKRVNPSVGYQIRFQKMFPFDKTISGTLTGEPASKCSYSVSYNTDLDFGSWDWIEPYNGHNNIKSKIDVFAEGWAIDWLESIGLLRTNSPTTPFPGMNEVGLATMNVNAQLAPSSHARDARAAAAGTKILTATFKVAAGRPQIVKLTRTSAGTAFLAAHPGAFPARVTVSFKPRHGAAVAASESFTFPAAG
jgi:hypothetical protein